LRRSVVLLLALAACAASTSGSFHLPTTSRAAAPFAAFNETRVALDGKCLRVLVATSEQQRVQGLRDVTSLTPYDGMFFVYGADTGARFTMANTPMPLDITFFDKDGKPVDDKQMTPCPNGTDATCPVYESKHHYRYALERPGGSGGSSGVLAPCAT
jgi:uncharacterized membrane protein (UPF0127 family)